MATPADRCKACQHPELPAINNILAEGRERYDFVARRFGLSVSDLMHHRENHLSQIAVSAAVDPVTLLSRLNFGCDRLFLQLELAIKANNVELEFKTIREMRAQIDLLLRATGLMGQGGTGLNNDQERTMMVIVNALAEFPDARKAVQQALIGAKRGTR